MFRLTVWIGIVGVLVSQAGGVRAAQDVGWGLPTPPEPTPPGQRRASAPLDEIWVGGWNTHNVLRIDVETGESLGMFVPRGAGGLQRAHHFSFGPDGHFYVASYGTSSILRYDGQTGKFMGVFVEPGNGLINAHTAYWHDDGTLLVSSENGNRVNQYDGKTGDFLRAFVEAGEFGLVGPEFIVKGADGFLYLSAHSRRVLKLDPVDGGVVEAFVVDDPETEEDETGGLTWAHGLHFGPDGNLYVASSQNHSVLRYDGDTGEFIDAFVPEGRGGLRFPVGIDFGPDGHLYVASLGNDLLLKYDGQSGAFLKQVADLRSMGLVGPLHIEFMAGPMQRFGDMDCDGSIDLTDVEPFILALLNPDEYANRYPDCDVTNADLSGDGSVDLRDVEPFIDLLIGP